MKMRITLVARVLLAVATVAVMVVAPLQADPLPIDPGASLPALSVTPQVIQPAEGWAPPMNVSTNSGPSGGPFLAVDSQATAHLAWFDASPGNWEILYATKQAAGSWGSYENASLNANYSLSPHVAIGRQDEVAIAWQDYGGPGPRLAWQGTIEYRDSDPGQGFNAPQLISATFGFGGMPEVREPHMVVDSANTTHLVWAGNTTGGYRIFYAQRLLSGAWMYPEVINPGYGMSVYPALAIDVHDRLHAVWQEGTVASGSLDIYYAYADPGGPWSTALNLSDNDGSSETPAIVVGADGTLHVVWKDNAGELTQSDILYTRKAADGVWTEAVNVSNTAGDSAGPVIAEDGVGAMHVVWYDGTPGNWDILYSMKRPGDGWTDAADVSNTPGRSGHPTLAYDGRGWLHLAWNDETPGEFDIFYSSKAVPVVGASSKQGPALALGGDELGYTIVVYNSGALPVTVWMTDRLPIETTYIPGSAQAAQGVLTVAGDEVRWSGDLPAGGEARISLHGRLRVDAPVGTDVLNQAVISDSNGGTVAVEAQTHVMRSRVWLPLIVGE